jgi:multidrug resistance protein, MATE family
MKSLTKHPPGSLFELLSIAVPLILTALSGSLFVFVDRIMLSYYSFDVVNAVSGVGVVFATLCYPGCAIAAITEVFVGQYNGAGQYTKIAEPVWQMIFFALASIVVYVPLGLLGESLFLSPVFIEEGLGYYQILVMGAPMFLLQSAVAGFFVGIGRPKLVTVAALVSNLMNIVLNYCLIFGVWIIPPLGAVGSATASMIAEGIQLCILFGVFFNKHNHLKYMTRKATANLKLLWEQLKIGVPGAVGHAFEIGAWAFLSNFRAGLGDVYVTVMTVSGTSYLLFSFYTDGLQKAVTAITSNMIGSRDYRHIENAKRSASILHAAFLALIFIPLVAWSEISIRPLIDIETLTPETLFAIKMALLGNFIFMIFDGYYWIYCGMLTAGGDTKTVMVVNSVSVWLFCVLPAVIWLTYFPSESYSVSLYSFPVYGAIVTGILYLRVRSNKWIKLDLSKD